MKYRHFVAAGRVTYWAIGSAEFSKVPCLGDSQEAKVGIELLGRTGQRRNDSLLVGTRQILGVLDGLLVDWCATNNPAKFPIKHTYGDACFRFMILDLVCLCLKY